MASRTAERRPPRDGLSFSHLQQGVSVIIYISMRSSEKKLSCYLSPGKGVIQIFAVAAASVLVDITLTAAEGIIGLRRLQLLPLHYRLMTTWNKKGTVAAGKQIEEVNPLCFQTPVKRLKESKMSPARK